MTLESVAGAVRRSKCARKCLSKLPELMILTHRYEAWKSKSYAERRQWILQILREAKVDPGEGGGRLTFAMKVNRHSVCNRCYADATGYSQRQFTNLKQSIQTHNRSSSEHGNNRRSREHSNIAACWAVLNNFFQECGCSQPHRHAKRLSDGKYVPLVLLPMHTQREDVLHMVNMAIPAMGATKKVSKARFDRMWHREFTNVQIPHSSRFSKCQICWEYKECMDAMPNEWQRQRIRESYHRHIDICNTERRRLLGIEANCNHQPQRNVVPQYRWYGPKHNNGSKILTECKRH